MRYLVLAIVFALILSLSFGGAQGHGVKAIQQHDVIRIDGDTDLANMASSEGWQGNGSVDNPYVIENYDIDAHGAKAAIYLGNISYRVVIRNCTLYNATQIAPYGWAAGVALYNATHVLVDNVTSHDNGQYGVFVSSLSYYATVKNSIFYSQSTKLTAGIGVTASHATLVNNSISNATYGIWLSGGYSSRLYSNTLIGSSIYIDYGWLAGDYDIPENNTVNGMPVLYLNGSWDNATVDTSGAGEVIIGGASWLTVIGLNVSDSGPSLMILDSSNVTVRDVKIYNCSGPGVNMDLAKNVWVENISYVGTGSWGMRVATSHGIVVKNASIQGYPYPFIYGVYMSVVHDVLISSLDVGGVTNGVYLTSYLSYNVTVANSEFHNFSRYGVYVYNSDASRYINNVTVESSTFFNKGYYGIYLVRVNNGEVRGNRIWSDAYSASTEGILISSFSKNIAVENNEIYGLRYGIYFGSAYDNAIRNNTVRNCYYAGIYLISSDGNVLEGNVLNYTGTFGIYIGTSSDSNEIRENYIANATSYGMYVQSGTSNNRIYNNSFYFNHGSNSTYNSSHVQGYDDSTQNYWYVEGTPHGYGNFWFDWTTPDSDGNGIVDNPYLLDGAGGAQDKYPLTTPTAQIPEFSGAMVIVLLVAMAIVVGRRLD